MDLAQEYYMKPEVAKEIVDYAKNRWVSVHCSQKDSKGRYLLVRYDRNKRPLTLNAPEDVVGLVKRLAKLRPRALYASSNLYRRLSSEYDVASMNNVYACTPCWDIDNDLEGWKDTVKVCQELVSLLDKEGVCKSVSVFWSGRGAHVRIHHEAFSRELRRKMNPLDIAFATVEYVLRKIEPHIVEKYSTGRGGRLKIENKMDPQRVFTCPLSLHRELDLVCICIPVNKLDQFTPGWAEPSSFKHSDEWKRYEEGEADELALKAHDIIGGYPIRTSRKRTRKYAKLDEAITRSLRKLLEEDSQL